MSRNSTTDVVSKVVLSIASIVTVIISIASFVKQIEFSILFSATFIIIVWLFCLTVLFYKLQREVYQLRRSIRQQIIETLQKESERRQKPPTSSL